MGLAERLNFALGDLDIVLKFAGENSAAVIYTADFEHEAGGLHRAVCLTTFDISGACLGSNIAVAGGIDDDFCKDRLSPGFVFDDDAGQPA